METAANLLRLLEGVFTVFSKCALKLLDNQADFDSAIRRFDPSRPSHPVLRLAIVRNLRLTGPEIPAFLAFDFVSRLPISQSRGRNGRKSPALSAKTPVLKRLLAESKSTGPPMYLSEGAKLAAASSCRWRRSAARFTFSFLII